MEVIIFAAGCFWGVEEAFREINGVASTTVGYTGGSFENPTYKDVCSGVTGHAEVVEIVFDPSIVTFEQLLDLFWRIHDPTTLNSQGPDVGSQYRSAIFYNTDEQKQIALKSKEELEKSGIYERPIVTEITSAGKFYKAEEYHQKYILKTGKAACGTHELEK